MDFSSQKVAGWGNCPARSGHLAQLGNPEALADHLRQGPCIARGNGRSYGDAALAARMVDTRAWDSFYSFEQDTGILHCASGVLLGGILRNTVPLGWTLPVLPGTQHVTVGGALAANIHGKNQMGALLFSDCVLDFQLMRSDGRMLHCSRDEHPELFWATCGGMGSTGIVLEARLQLEPITTTLLEQLTIETQNMEHLLHTLDSQRDFQYAAAWHHPMGGTGRAFFARPASGTNKLIFRPKQRLNIPFFLPGFLLNKNSIAAYNAYFGWKNPVGIRQVPMERFFFPLDGIGHWNRLYGRRGLVQYHACFPHNTALEANNALLSALAGMGITPFLVVVKKHRAPIEPLLHQFLQEGFSIAIDMPNQQNMGMFIAALDKITLRLGGKVYAAKDAFSIKSVLSIDSGRIEPDGKFVSDLMLRG